MSNLRSNFYPGYFDNEPEEEPSNQLPVSKKVLKKLPIFKIEEKHGKKGSSGILEYPGCAVCCSSISLGDMCMLLPCGHMYHPICIDPWLKEHNTCPTCRYELPTDDPIYEQNRRV